VTNFSPYTKLKSFDWALEATSLVIIGISWWYMLSNFADIPQIIPVHFNIQGEPDRFGDKSELFTLLYVATGLYSLLLLLSFFPQFHNIPTTLTEVNTEEKRRLSARMLRTVNVVMCLIFLVLSATSVYNALNGLESQNPWVLFLLIGLLFAAIIYYWSKLAKK
tara:strand:+ start:318 stop:809 length:492 start_codon:yes stop_codon:yes gene_type:complete